MYTDTSVWFSYTRVLLFHLRCSTAAITVVKVESVKPCSAVAVTQRSNGSAHTTTLITDATMICR